MKKIMTTIFTAVVACCMFTANGQEVEMFVKQMLNHYPEARLLDIYKSCFQDYMGAEHLVGDTAAVRAYLDQELAQTDIAKLQPWHIEPCGIEGRYVRVSLRAVIEGKTTADALLDAFIASANGGKRPSVKQWAKQWRKIIRKIDLMGITLPHYDEDKAFIDSALKQGKYAISHSPEYRQAYSPHYRIVKQEFLPRLGLL